MKKEHLYQLISTFEVHAQTTDNEVEFWLARDLQNLLGYVELGKGAERERSS